MSGEPGSAVLGLVVPPHPHPLLVPEQNAGWQRLRDAFGEARQAIIDSDADLLLLYSTTWPSVIGHQIQADPEPEWVHVDELFHGIGSMPYKLRMDVEFAAAFHAANLARGLQSRTVAHHGFPIDTGSIVALQLLNGDNRIPACLVSSNVYADRAETVVLAKAAMDAAVATGRRVAAVAVTSLSNRMFTEWIDPAADHIHSPKDDEWNRKMLEFLGAGRLEDTAQLSREVHQQVRVSKVVNFKPMWWLSSIFGQHNRFSGCVHAYEALMGCGGAVVSLVPTAQGIGDKEYDEEEVETWQGDRDVLETAAAGPGAALGGEAGDSGAGGGRIAIGGPGSAGAGGESAGDDPGDSKVAMAGMLGMLSDVLGTATGAGKEVRRSIEGASSGTPGALREQLEALSGGALAAAAPELAAILAKLGLEPGSTPDPLEVMTAVKGRVAGLSARLAQQSEGAGGGMPAGLEEMLGQLKGALAGAGLGGLAQSVAAGAKHAADAAGAVAGTASAAGRSTPATALSEAFDVADESAPAPVGPYPHARRVGDLLYLSGIGPRRPRTDEIPGGPVRDADGQSLDYDVAAQTRSCIENIAAILEAAGSSLAKVLDVMVFLIDMDRDFVTFSEVYAEYFNEIRPTRTTVAVRALPTPIAVELKVIATP